MNFDLDKLIRKNIKDLKPYSSARNEYDGTDAILLDANESPFNNPYNRYPDPLQKQLKKKVAEILNKKYISAASNQLSTINEQRIFLGNGSDEAIDLMMRAFCEPAEDNIICPDPSYGMYEVSANINNVRFIKVLLTPAFELAPDKIIENIDNHTKLIFICSPNNPTSNSFKRNDVLKIIESFSGIVIIDEAYIDFSINESYLKYLDKYPNLVILQTFSKSKAMAGVRLGMAIASEKIIHLLNKIKYPYNVNLLTQQFAFEAIDSNVQNNDWIKNILNERKKLEKGFEGLPFVEKVFPSDANFLLVRVNRHKELFDFLIGKKIVIRDRSKQKLCENCLRITIGTESENNALIQAMNDFKTLMINDK